MVGGSLNDVVLPAAFLCMALPSGRRAVRFSLYW